MHKSSEKDIIVFYHANCPDGFGAAWASWKHLGESAEYFPVHYNLPITQNIVGKKVYSVDFTFEGEQFPQVLREASSYTVIDHHVSNTERAKQATESVFDNTHSGAMLVWKYFNPDVPVPKLLEYIEDNDLWKFTLPNSKESAAAVAAHNFDFKTFDELQEIYENPEKFARYLEGGKLILGKSGKDAGEISDEHYFIEFEGRKIPVVNTPLHVSDIGHRMATKYPPMAMMWCRRKNNITISMRGDGSVDLSALAAKYGGGGHHDAAGFLIPLEALNEPENLAKKELLVKLMSTSQI